MLVLLVVGFGVATVGWVDHAVADATVEDAEPTTVTVSESEMSEYAGTADEETEYSVTIVYEYELDGETYQSSNIYPGVSDRRYSSQARARGIVDRYPEGETATGYVDPDAPGRAYLLERSDANSIWNSVGNVVAVGIGSLLFLAGAVGALRSAAQIER